MVYELKGRKNICAFGNVITLQRNITKKQIWEKAACSKLQSTLNKVWLPIQFQKLM